MTPLHNSNASLAARLRASVVLVVFSLISVTGAYADAPLKTYASLTLNDGREFYSVEVVNYTTTGVLVRHAKGATTLRLNVLPQQMLTDLHLDGQRDAVRKAQQDYLELANKPALPDMADMVAADAPVPASANLPQADAVAVLPEAAQVVAHAATEEIVASEVGAIPASPAPAALQSVYVDVVGRFVVSLPSSGTHFLGDVEVRGYPAELFSEYLVQAKGRAREAAQRLLALAAAAAKEGRVADYTSLAAQAEKAAARFYDYFPAAPVTARSDEFGNFTLHHRLRDVRIVAAGRLNGGEGEWNFEWVGITLENDATFTEKNATSVVPVGLGNGIAPKYAAK